jgi:hypothetical protein
MAHQMHPAAGGRIGALDSIVQPPADQQVWTFRIPADARKIRPVADRPQPGEHLAKVGIRTQETGDQDDGFPVAVRHAESIEDRRQP